MADRRSSPFLRFWSQPTARRTPTTQTSTPTPVTQRNGAPPATTKSIPSPSRTESQTASQTPANVTVPPSTAPSKAETQTTASQSTTTPSPQPATETRTSSPKTTDLTTSALPTGEPQISLPTPPSPPASERASPSRKAAQSRSPPLSSSPSRVGAQARSTPSSPSRMGSEPTRPQRTPQPRSPSRLVTRSPNQVLLPANKPVSPSREPRRSNVEIPNSQALVSDEKRSNLAPSQQETLGPQMKTEVKSDDNNHLNAGIADETSKKEEIKRIVSAAESSITSPTSGNSETISTNNGEAKTLTESKAKTEESTEVKEVVRTSSAAANEGTKQVDNSLEKKSESEAQTTMKEDIPSKLDQVHGKNDGVPEINGKPINTTTLKATNTNSQPRRGRIISNTQNHTNGENLPSNKDIRDDISAFVNRLGIGNPKNSIDDRPVSVITLAGENRGASMQMGSNSPAREGLVPIHRGYKTNPDERVEAPTDGEGSSKRNNPENAIATEDQPTEAYVNNNSQGINNSIVFNSSITEGNPGVHLVINLVPKETVESSIDKTRPETRKVEFSSTPAEKLTYEPTMRRRCLRGLFLEPSDSDSDNPEKPRRHGCRVGCEKKGEDNNIDVL